MSTGPGDSKDGQSYDAGVSEWQLLRVGQADVDLEREVPQLRDLRTEGSEARLHLRRARLLELAKAVVLRLPAPGVKGTTDLELLQPRARAAGCAA